MSEKLKKSRSYQPRQCSKGPWLASDDGREIASDDFTHDVVLRVTGDFESDELRKAYADNLAAKLNAHNV